MDDRRIPVSTKVIDAAMFFGHVLGPATFYDAEKVRWEWWYDEDDEDSGDDNEHLLGHWIILTLSEAGELRASILSHLTDRSMQYKLIGYCAVNGIPYSTSHAPELTPVSDADSNIFKLRDHKKRPRNRPV